MLSSRLIRKVPVFILPKVPSRKFTITYALIDSYMTYSTFYGLLTTNLFTGCKILHRGIDIEKYHLVNVIFISLIKSWFYSYIWPIFWFYSITRPMCLLQLSCTLDVKNKEDWYHNYNGLVRHLIPMYYEIVFIEGKDMDKVREENNFWSAFLECVNGIICNISKSLGLGSNRFL
jgi:hypothetical protein